MRDTPLLRRQITERNLAILLLSGQSNHCEILMIIRDVDHLPDLFGLAVDQTSKPEHKPDSRPLEEEEKTLLDVLLFKRKQSIGDGDIVNQPSLFKQFSTNRSDQIIVILIKSTSANLEQRLTRILRGTLQHDELSVSREEVDGHHDMSPNDIGLEFGHDRTKKLSDLSKKLSNLHDIPLQSL
jgi:hypothetical protein